MSEKILVVANGEPPSFELLQNLFKDHQQLVAVDGGLSTCLKYGFEPDLLMGDFDSISKEIRSEFTHVPQIHIPDQNKSDLEKTLSYLFDSHPEVITVCGALGKRLDHTLVNIHLLTRYPEELKFASDTETCFALKKSSLLSCQIGQTLSLIPVSTHVSGVITHGLKWELHGDELSKDFLSLSNVCLERTVSITFEAGDLLVCMG